MVCNFCGKRTDVEKIEKSAKSYICGNCVAYLGSRDQEELLRGYLLALEKEYFSKAKAIESFLEVNTDEPVNRYYIAKRSDRKGLPFIKISQRNRLYFEKDIIDFFTNQRMVLNRAEID